MPPVRGLEPGKRAALVVNEMQNAIANPAYVDTPLAAQVTARGIVARINVLTAAFRAAGAPVIFCTIAARTPDWAGFRVNCALAARIRRKRHAGRRHRQRRHPRRPGRRAVRHREPPRARHGAVHRHHP